MWICIDVALQRANYVAKICKSALNQIVRAPKIYGNGWTVTSDIEWVEQIFPDVAEDILMDDEYEETYDFDSDVERLWNWYDLNWENLLFDASINNDT